MPNYDKMDILSQKKNPDDITLAEHAEAWWKEKGKKVPTKGTKEWKKMYETWANWAFSNMR